MSRKDLRIRRKIEFSGFSMKVVISYVFIFFFFFAPYVIVYRFISIVIPVIFSQRFSCRNIRIILAIILNEETKHIVKLEFKIITTIQTGT